MEKRKRIIIAWGVCLFAYIFFAIIGVWLIKISSQDYELYLISLAVFIGIIGGARTYFVLNNITEK